MRQTRFKSVAQMLWYMNHGYRGKSRKWARRRSKHAVAITAQFADDMYIKAFRQKAGA